MAGVVGASHTVTVTRGNNGNYGWSIVATAQGASPEAIRSTVETIRLIDTEMRERRLGDGGGDGDG